MQVLSLCFIAFRIVDLIDILLVALLLYALYKLLKGTAAINILIGIIAIFILWKIVEVLDMKMLTEILGAFISVGFLALIIVFQPEIREFLLLIGKPIGSRSRKQRSAFFKRFTETKENYNYNVLLHAVYTMAKEKVGASLILTRENNLHKIVQSGEKINADISSRLLMNLFYKNSPLHDGAVIISGNKIIAAACILPLSQSTELPPMYGLRHRSAIGVTEQTDAIAIIISEQRGTVSFSAEGQIINDIKLPDLANKLNSYFPGSIKNI